MYKAGHSFVTASLLPIVNPVMTRKTLPEGRSSCAHLMNDDDDDEHCDWRGRFLQCTLTVTPPLLPLLCATTCIL